MMEEIEVKILNINRKEVEEKLKSLGAKKIFDDELIASFFDFQDSSIRDNDKTVRLRKEGKEVFLTFKSRVPNDKVKIRKEIETEVTNFNKTKQILEALGLSEFKTVRKHRTSYKLDNVRFELDNHLGKYEFVPEFLEIEATTPEEIYEYANLLGFKKEDCKPWTLLDIIENNHSIQTSLS